MVTLRHLVYDLMEIIHNYSVDSNYTVEYLAYQINNTRNLLLQQKFSSRSYIIPNKLRQSFYHDLELTEENEFVSGLGTIVRTKDPIQLPLEPFNFTSNFRINSGSYTDINFTFVPWERLPYVGSNKWIPNQIYCSIGTDWRLYFVSNNPTIKAIDKVKLSYVTENPESAYPSSTQYDASVSYWDVPYHMEDNMINTLMDIITKKLGISLAIPEDKVNDSNDN